MRECGLGFWVIASYCLRGESGANATAPMADPLLRLLHSAQVRADKWFADYIGSCAGSSAFHATLGA